MEQWRAYTDRLFYDAGSEMMLDYSKINLGDDFYASMNGKMDEAISHMADILAGAEANPDEGRMVGHYWLRAPELAPTAELRQEIEETVQAVTAFAGKVHSGEVCSTTGKKFTYAVVVGIGGSSLGPLFVAEALRSGADKMQLRFMDNTDPSGMDDLFQEIDGKLDSVLTIVISKSGGTIETRNGMEEMRALYTKAGLNFADYAVCITGKDSKLDNMAASENWIARFPMWDWVGGRTSVLSAVGLLPLALQGIDIDSLLRGARECDVLCRNKDWRQNPGAIMAASWYGKTGGVGGTTLAILPYKDRLSLLTTYLQQLMMESLGKELDLDGKQVRQGLAVFGRKGSSDQHSYVQQLIAGPENVFILFIQVMQDRVGMSPVVGENSNSGDYLQAFMLGTEKALQANGKGSMTLSVPVVNAYTIGMMIALFEQSVGMYAKMININAYHQPAVEAGKKAAGELIRLKNEMLAYLGENGGKWYTPAELAEAMGIPADVENIFKLLLHQAASGDKLVKMEKAAPIWESRFSV